MNNMKTKKEILEYLLAFLLLTFISLFLMEYVWRDNALETMLWICNYPNRIFLEYIVAIFFMLILIILTKRLWLSFFIHSILFQILSVINYFKVLFREDVFQISDINLASDAASILNTYELTVTDSMIEAWISIIIFTVITYHFTKLHIKKYIRIILGSASIIVLSVYIIYLPSILEKSGADTTLMLAKNYYTQNGYISGLIKSIPQKVKEPDNYSQELVENIFSTLPTDDNASEQKPNLIFIMNESFYDVSQLDAVKLSDDIMPNIRKLQQEHLSGTIISPAYGGGTSQVEYEVLSAYPSTNTSGYPFVDTIKGPFYSIAELLKKEGYYSMFLHPNTKLFYNRYQVYQYMGFDKTIFLEDISSSLDHEGFYVSDKATYDLLIQDYEQNQNSDRPYFSYVVTIQNHGGYAYDYNKYGIISLNDMGTAENKQQLETFSNLIRESDESLMYLLNYFEEISEPTIIVFWGDHAPSLSPMGISIDGIKDLSIRQTPLLIWSNYTIDSIYTLDSINAFKLGALVLKIAGIRSDPYFNFIADSEILLRNNRSSSRSAYWYQNTWYPKEKLPETYLNNEMIQWLLQYDRMFGKKYTLK